MISEKIIETYRVTFRIPKNFISPGYRTQVLIAKSLMEAVNGKFIRLSYGSAPRYEYELHEYDVPKINETFISNVLIDLGTESKLTIDYK